MDQIDMQDDTSSVAPIERIVRSLEEEIVLGRLKPRERLLEEELAKHFDAKRHVIRAALAELETMGIIVRQPNKGAAVRDFSPLEVEQIYDVRLLLERHATSIMPLPAAPDLLDKLRVIHARHSKAIDDQEPRTVFRANLEFHRVLYGACGNPYLAEQIDALASRAHAIRFHAITDEKLVNQAREEHGLMIDYMEKGDREKLAEIVGRHMQPSKEAYLRLASAQWARPFR
jgi:DNA-binding GntR family transcriptional regulator